MKGQGLSQESAEVRLAKWKADKAKRRGQMLSQQIEIQQQRSKANDRKVVVDTGKAKKSKIVAKKIKSPKVPIREKFETWKTRKNETRTVAQTQPSARLKTRTQNVSQPPKVDIIARNKILATKRRDVKSDAAKRRETLLVTKKENSKPPVSTQIKKVKKRASLTSAKTATSRRSTLVIGRKNAGAEQNKRRVTIAVEVKKPGKNYRSVPSRIDTGLSTLRKRKFEKLEETPKRLKSVAKSPRSCVRFKTTPLLERNTPVRKEGSMREKLNSWLVSRGKTPSKFHHLLSLNEPSVDNPVDGGLSVLDLNLQQQILENENDSPETPEENLSHHEEPAEEDKLNALLNEVQHLTNEGCPTVTLRMLLQRILREHPSCSRSADFWVCKAKVENGNQEEVLRIFDEAVEHQAEPPEVIAGALQQYVSETMLENVIPVKRDDEFPSSVVKFCYANTNSTPFFKKYRPTPTEPHTPSALITPVRRSTRKSLLRLPMMLQDHDVVVESLDDFTQDSLRTALFVPNRALVPSQDV